LAVFSAPGAGKTHLLKERIMEEEKANNVQSVQRIDCSSDELVENSLHAFLNNHFPKEEKSLLVADEYHMLSEQHKEELVQWVLPRLSWLKVVLLGNRSDGECRRIVSAAYSTDPFHFRSSEQHLIRNFSVASANKSDLSLLRASRAVWGSKRSSPSAATTSAISSPRTFNSSSRCGALQRVVCSATRA
jgi:hypothetical protein